MEHVTLLLDEIDYLKADSDMWQARYAVAESLLVECDNAQPSTPWWHYVAAGLVGGAAGYAAGR